MLCTITFPKSTLTWEKYIFKTIIELALWNFFIYFREAQKYTYRYIVFFVSFTVFLMYRDNFSMFKFIRKFTPIHTVVEVFAYINFAKTSKFNLITLVGMSVFWQLFLMFKLRITFTTSSVVVFLKEKIDSKFSSETPRCFLECSIIAERE